MRLNKVVLTLIAMAGCIAAFPAIAAEQYPVGTAIVIKHCNSIEVESDNPKLYHLNGTAIIFDKPGVAKLKIVAKYGNNSAMLFEESVNIVPNDGLRNVKLTFNPSTNSFEAIGSVRKESENAAYIPIDFGGYGNAAHQTGQVREIVPMDQLQNKALLHWNLTDDQYTQCYSAALQFVQPLAHLRNRKEIIRELAVSLRKFSDSQVTYSSEAPHFLDAYGFFVNRTASCQGETCATGFCLNMLGIEYEHVNHNKWKHQWCRVKVEDGTYWICDAYGLYCGPEPAPYQHPRVK